MARNLYAIVNIEDVSSQWFDNNLLVANDISKLRKSLDGTKILLKLPMTVKDGSEEEFFDMYSWYDEIEIKTILSGEEYFNI